MKIKQNDVIDALLNSGVSRDHSAIVWRYSGKAMGRDTCLGLELTFASDAVRFMNEMAILLTVVYGHGDGSRAAREMAKFASLHKDDQFHHWVLYFPGVEAE